MIAPEFWKKRGFWSEAVLPLSVITFLWNRGRERYAKSHPPFRASVPVLCIGNITAGGAGKTPLALHLGAELQRSGKKIAYLSRGYKGSEKGPLKVDPAKHTAREVGDEPLLLAGTAPTWIGADRGVTAQQALKEGTQVLIMDDGLSNETLAKDCSLLVVDGGFGFGNHLLLPAGPLRDRPDLLFKKAKGIVLMGEDSNNITSKLLASTLPVLEAKTRHALPPETLAEMQQKNWVAFAGIGRPEKFFATLAQSGLKVMRSFAFGDHYNYMEQDLEELAEAANVLGARLITTEKDFVRLPIDFRKNVSVLPIRLEMDTSALMDIIRQNTRL